MMPIYLWEKHNSEKYIWDTCFSALTHFWQQGFSLLYNNVISCRCYILLFQVFDNHIWWIMWMCVYRPIYSCQNCLRPYICTSPNIYWFGSKMFVACHGGHCAVSVITYWLLDDTSVHFFHTATWECIDPHF